MFECLLIYLWINDPLFRICLVQYNCMFQDAQTTKTDLSSNEPSDAARDLPLDLSIKDEATVVTAVPAEQTSVFGVEGDRGKDFNKNDCWSASSLIGSFFVDFFYKI